MTLGETIRPCGPVVDAPAAERLLKTLRPHAQAGGWRQTLDQAWPALAPVFAAAPYLAGLARRSPEHLAEILRAPADATLAAILNDAEAAAGADSPDEAGEILRICKRRLHLLTAIADLGGVWDLGQVTGALSRFADAALASALEALARAETENGRLFAGDNANGAGPVPGLFCIAMGKYGAFELNYSSDIDISVFYAPEVLPLADDGEPQRFAVRLAKGLARLIQDATGEGYVFRVDLRLRPDPGATPIAVPVEAALDYYVTLGQNWERAAFIKARPCAGDIPRAEAFLKEIQPFIWRKNLDFAAIADIHSIKRQIHVHKVDERLDPRGADLKLGRGGIREIEFYVQTQQLILGGRDPDLRSNRTLEALAALAGAGQIEPDAAAELADSYERLRALEHRVQMAGDEHTHKLPESDADRKRIAALYGAKDLRSFDAEVRTLLVGVNRRYGELFAEDEDLSSRFGSLVFTGVEDDPATLQTLERMGFEDPAKVSGTIRTWHHGRIAATRSERGRELFTRLAPKLLDAAHDSGAPNAAFLRFTEFFANLNSGVQVQSLFLAQPKLFQLVVDVLALSPKLARTLSHNPAALDAMMDADFFAPVRPDQLNEAVFTYADQAGDFEGKMDAVRRAHREQVFRIGVQLMAGIATAAEAGPAFTALADACMRALSPAALAETERVGGAFAGDVAVIALGKCGSGEMNATSDLDLVVVYRARDGEVSKDKGWWAETFYGRFTHRLVAALSAPTGEGGLYEVDLKLRPYGNDGSIAVRDTGFAAYYQDNAEIWEMMALTRARVVWSTSDKLAADISRMIEEALRRPRERAEVARAVRDMRRLIEEEKPAGGFWDVKLSPGGLIDIEFAAQFLQLVSAGQGGPLTQNTFGALEALKAAGAADAKLLDALQSALRHQQDILQILKAALVEDADPSQEPSGLRKLLAAAGGVKDIDALVRRLTAERKAARAAYQAIVS
jgi:glutamate-ammonia-ligase adenylyltransferase